MIPAAFTGSDAIDLLVLILGVLLIIWVAQGVMGRR